MLTCLSSAPLVIDFNAGAVATYSTSAEDSAYNSPAMNRDLTRSKSKH